MPLAQQQREHTLLTTLYKQAILGSSTPLKMEAESGYTYEEYEGMARCISSRTSHKPTIGVICGSGLGGLADLLENTDTIPYSSIPGFPESTVAGHKGQFVLGVLKGVPIICMQGRFHPYEGYPMWKCAMPVRVMKLLGVKLLIVTNAAGGINRDYSVGDIMLIKDHINCPAFAGNNPLKGPNDSRWGPRFIGLNNPYDLKIRQLAKKVAEQLGLSSILREGVYSMYGGPNYETVSELRALSVIGADAVGMSTVHEVIMAKHCGLRVFGLSLITNRCVLDYDVERAANHAEVLEATEKRKADLEKMISALVAECRDV